MSFSFVEFTSLHFIIDRGVDEGSLALRRVAWLSCLVVDCSGIGFSFLLLFGIAGGLSGIGGGATCAEIGKFAILPSPALSLF